MCDLDQDFDHDYVSFTPKDVTARTIHYCEECSQQIKPGAKYRRQAGKVDGDFWSMVTCRRCAKAQDWLIKRGHGWRGGCIISDVKYCVEQELAEHGTLK